MKGSKDLWFLIGVLAVGAVLIYLFAPNKEGVDNRPSSYSSGKLGLKALYLGLDDLGFRVGRQTKPVAAIPKDARLLISPPVRLDDNDKELSALNDWLSRGNTLILSDANVVFGLAAELGFEADVEHHPSPFPQQVAPSIGRYSDGVRRVDVHPLNFIDRTPGCSPIVTSDHGMVVAERKVGKGSVILVVDEGMLSNAGIGSEDNFVFVSNLVYEHARKGDRVLFAEWPEMLASAEKPRGPLVGPGGKFAIFELVAVTLVVLLSASRRFGAVHPLPETQEKRRGAEFVLAMAALYGRAHAREAAVVGVYRTFRLELATRYGASPAMTSSQAAEAVSRSSTVDRVKLAAVLERCDLIADGTATVGESDAMQLVQAIEELRRELGIARSRHN